MAYATLDQFKRRIKINVDDQSVHTDDEIGSMLEAVTGVINSTLIGVGIDAPIVKADAPNAFDVLIELNNVGVAARIFSGKSQSEIDVEGKETDFREQFDNGLKNIRENPGEIKNELADDLHDSVPLPVGQTLAEAPPVFFNDTTTTPLNRKDI